MPRSFLVKKKRGASGGWQWKEPEQLEWKEDHFRGMVGFSILDPHVRTMKSKPGLFALIFAFVFLLGTGKADAPDVPPPAPVTQPVATLACVAASLRVPAQLAGTAKSGTNCRPDWPTGTLGDYPYHPSTLALSRAKVRSDSAPPLTQVDEASVYMEFIGWEPVCSWGAAPPHRFGGVFPTWGRRGSRIWAM